LPVDHGKLIWQGAAVSMLSVAKPCASEVRYQPTHHDEIFNTVGDHMITSRRGFLRSLGAGTAAGIAVHSPLMGISRAAIFEPSRPKQDDGFIRLNSNENAYGPSTKVADTMKSSIGSANRYPRMEYSWLVERIAGAIM
jgi:hypothetical protein